MTLTGNPYLYDHIKANAEEKNVLILSHMECPITRFDGKRVSYMVEYRWISKSPTEDGDEVCCVLGNDCSYWSKRELKELGAFNEHSSLFDCFNLF